MAIDNINTTEVSHVSIPSVSSLLSTKNIREMMKDARAFIHENHLKHGPIWEQNILGERIIQVADPEFIKYVLLANKENYIKSKSIETLKLALGNGLVTSEGELWKNQRKLMQPAFHMNSLIQMFDTMKQEVISFVDGLEGNRGDIIDIHRSFMEITGNVVFKALFSDQPDSSVSSLYEVMTEGQRFINKRLRNPLSKYLHAINGETRKFNRNKEEGIKFLTNTINRRKKSVDKKPDLLQMLLDASYEGTNEFMSDQQLLDEVITIFSAGHETSSNALTWTIHLLTQHPEVVKKIHKEIKKVCQDKLPGYKELREMPYLMQVINESMRMYPPVWLLSRRAVAKDEFNGIVINPDDNISIDIYSLHHSPALYDNPEKFDPDRFANNIGREWSKNQKFIPFGGGPRMCIGFMFATMEIQLILVALLQRFEITAVPQKVEMEAMVTMQPKNGLKVLIK